MKLKKEENLELNSSKEDFKELNDAYDNWKHEKLEEEISRLFDDS